MRSNRPNLIGALLAVLAGTGLHAAVSPPAPSAPRPRGKSKAPSFMRQAYRRTFRLPHEGGQEIARRRAQIERGQLTGSNGLVVVRHGD